MSKDCTNGPAATGLESSTTPALLSHRPIYSLFFGSGKVEENENSRCA
jgi:hypothetical protein